MNLYQKLNQEYREFKIKESLNESSKVKKPQFNKIIKEGETNTEGIKDLDEKLKGLEDELNNTTDPKEKEEIQKQINELKSKLDKEDIKTESSIMVNADDTGNVNVCVTSDAPTEEQVEVPTEEVTTPDEEVTTPNEEPTEVLTEEPVTDSEEVKKLVCKECGAEIQDGELCNECSSKKESEQITETEVSSFKVTRISPKFNAYMIEAQTKDGIQYITGKNFNKEEKTLDEAEITSSKKDATERFKSLLS